MVWQRIMTAAVAVVVCAFSVSVFGCLWRLNEGVKGFEFEAIGDDIVWEMSRHTLQISFEEGQFERFVLYRRESA